MERLRTSLASSFSVRLFHFPRKMYLLETLIISHFSNFYWLSSISLPSKSYFSQLGWKVESLICQSTHFCGFKADHMGQNSFMISQNRLKRSELFFSLIKTDCKDENVFYKTMPVPTKKWTIKNQLLWLFCIWLIFLLSANFQQSVTKLDPIFY